MKINLKYQLCWYYSSNLVSDLRSARLEVIALLKSKELTQTLLLLSTTATGLAARISIIDALTIPENHENFTRNWTDASKAFSTFLSSYPDVLYVSVQNLTLDKCYLNITTVTGNQIFEDYGLVPVGHYFEAPILDNLNIPAAFNALEGAPGNVSTLIPAEDRDGIVPANATRSGLFLGPLMFNTTTSQTGPIYVASLTVPVFNNTTAVLSARNILGYMTVVFNLQSLIDITKSTEGLGKTGKVLLLGPESRLNRWDNTTGEFRLTENYQYILPPTNSPELALRKVPVRQYPAAMRAWQNSNARGGISGVDLDTRDAFGTKSSVGYSSVTFDATNSSFLLMVEQTYAEAFEPMHKLRTIVIATVFGTVGLILIVTFPVAHYAVRPIRRLHMATKLCGRPPEYREEPKRRPWWSPGFGRGSRISNISDTSSQNSSGRRDNFRIPQKVPLDRHYITDELTALINTFNAMTEELLEQYEKLEEKVRQRTEQLEQQTVLAESANEAKTMFIANVSHELRTPLNGILGMCSLVLEETSLPQATRENLEVVFKSGQLLLHLLNDLITFSKNQVWGAQVTLENSPFRIRDFISQISALFDSQARDKNIELTYEVVPRDGMEFVLIGDVNRILQVIINLISNSLKFTNDGGSVQLMIVMESIPTTGSVDITPYSIDETGTADYMSSPIFFNSPANSPSTEITSPRPSPSPRHSPPPSTQRPTRPPLFTRRSTTSGAANTESDITKTLLTRSKKFLNPETAAEAPRSHVPSPSSSSTAHYVEFRVIDTGPGVSEGMQEKIFEPFVQADVGLSRKYGGTGLGLSICQQLAKLMGGDVHLKSFEGAGSTFTLRIPLHFSAQSLTSAASASSNEYPRRPLSISNKSGPTTTRSLSAFSGAFSGASRRSGGKDSQGEGNLRLVGLSQPFFVPSRNESEESFEHRDQMTPVTEVDTPAVSTIRGTVRSSRGDGYDFPPLLTPEEGDEHEEKRREGLPEVRVDSPDTEKGPSGAADTEKTGTTTATTKSEPETAVAEKEKEKSAQQEPAEKPEPSGSAEEDKSIIKVLVVEDNKINQKLVTKVLQLEGVKEVTLAEDGQEAIDRVKEVMVQQRVFDIVFMDIQMPNVDGHEATRQIRAMGYKAPIIALTAFAEESNIRECYDAGMDCFLAKPIKRPQIRQMIDTYCPGKEKN
ncbi:Similar to Two-component system protein B; acc. no. Q9P4U6 [Pyronema omphalodes CBS 100304]|uniref:histidine kinase n=1 Tax=Pyronema omphalodes (strain CBS 100304) TaxID=1076935 RepID=U4L087_PYROM|nr:Similar to Two-component system protein B; acc. no. Q9P4U6 [Pyronema omphalodes CBS 100304]